MASLCRSENLKNKQALKQWLILIQELFEEVIYMKKFSMLFLAAAVALVGAIVAPNKAEAVPAFARQVGVACYACHFQHIPKLNSFGREFKLGGFTQSAQDLLTDDGLSIPPVLNASMVAKYRYQMGTDTAKADDGTATGINRGEFQIYDEFAILAGGRVAENMGTLVEFGAGVLSSKFVFSKDFGGVRGGVAVYQTDGLGVGYAMELFNTGAQRNQRGFEERSWFANQQGSSPQSGAAEGLHFFGGSSLFFASFGLWGPANGTVDTGFELSTYYRIAITPKIGDMDLMVGLQGVAGETKVSTVAGSAAVDADGNGTADSIYKAKTDSMTLDAQLQADLGGMSLEVIAAYQTTKNGTAYNGNTNDTKNLSVGAELGFGHAGLKLGMGMLNNGKATKAEQTVTVLGAWFAPAQNVDLVLELASYSGDAKSRDSRTTVMLEFAF